MTLGETVRTPINHLFKAVAYHVVGMYSLSWVELVECGDGEGEEEMLYFSGGTGCSKVGFYMRKRHVQDTT